MPPAYYRLSIAVVASVSLTLAACSSAPDAKAPGAANGGKQAAADPLNYDYDTDATIWTILGMAKKRSERARGPATGDRVSPVLWQAVHDTLDFVPAANEDAVTGTLATDWYSPQSKPDERFRVNVYILAWALRSDSIAVEVERQVRNPAAGWADAPVERKLVQNLEDEILRRARQLKQAWSAQPS
jgi:hypothetical protein